QFALEPTHGGVLDRIHAMLDQRGVDAQPPGHERDGGPLQQNRGQHDEKDHVKIRSAPSRPASSGKVARITGAAPRKPTQEISVFSRQLNLLNSRLIKTLAGRAANIRPRAISRPTPTMGTRREGK